VPSWPALLLFLRCCYRPLRHHLTIAKSLLSELSYADGP
jgi:hypothetical protein